MGPPSPGDVTPRGQPWGGGLTPFGPAEGDFFLNALHFLFDALFSGPL